MTETEGGGYIVRQARIDVREITAARDGEELIESLALRAYLKQTGRA